MSHRKPPTPECRHDAGRRALTSGRTRGEIADDLGIGLSTHRPKTPSPDTSTGSITMSDGIHRSVSNPLSHSSGGREVSETLSTKSGKL
jgi:hypothetical protein